MSGQASALKTKIIAFLWLGHDTPITDSTLSYWDVLSSRPCNITILDNEYITEDRSIYILYIIDVFCCFLFLFLFFCFFIGPSSLF